MIVKENCKEVITDPKDVFKIMKPIYEARPDGEKHKEYFYLMGLDSRNRIKIIDLIGFGSINECAIYPREIFRVAIIKDCVSIIVIHNHPSGRLEVSPEDSAVTKRIKSGCKILDIKFLDHVIVSETDFIHFQ